MVLTNGAGGITEHWTPGTPVLISDHINLTANSPLEGATFVDLTDLYSQRLRDIARSVDPTLDEGVYTQFRGPHYETPAEVQMVKAIGGHIVWTAIVAGCIGLEPRISGIDSDEFLERRPGEFRVDQCKFYFISGATALATTGMLSASRPAMLIRLLRTM